MATQEQIDELVKAGLALKMELMVINGLEEGDLPSLTRFIHALHALPETKAEVLVQKAKLEACLNKGLGNVASE